MPSPRRQFVIRTAAYAAGFTALGRWAAARGEAQNSANAAGAARYGPLVSDPHGLFDLPKGFSYQIISRSGQSMDDGLIVPGKPDGMASFSVQDGLTVLIRNHELEPHESPGPFGESNNRIKNVPVTHLYDAGGGQTPHLGGTTTLVYDTRKRKLVRQFLSLAGTTRNCAGGPTPWNSWISCEETVISAGQTCNYQSERDHGYNFEVPVSCTSGVVKATPLTDMGRFNHEAVAVDPQTSVVYQTEDRDDGLLYRYVPVIPGKLAAGGRLQVLRVADRRPSDLRNWGNSSNVKIGQKMSVEWIDIDDVTSPADDLRYRGFELGAARFARGEGMWCARGEVYFACTNGGRERSGQIWKYVPWPSPDKHRPNSGGTLELFVEPNDSRLLESADNITAAPWGDLIVCEDRQSDTVRLIGITADGQLYTMANSNSQSELTGATFSPDGSTLFVNIQGLGLTLAISGQW